MVNTLRRHNDMTIAHTITTPTVSAWMPSMRGCPVLNNPPCPSFGLCSSSMKSPAMYWKKTQMRLCAVTRLRVSPQLLTVTETSNRNCWWTHEVIMMQYLLLHVAALNHEVLSTIIS